MSHLANNQMASGSDFLSTKPELSGLKKHKFISGVFEGKCPSDFESAWSPTSPLDFRVFSSLGNPFGGSSSRSVRKGHQKSWDSGKVGLSIVDSLDDHHTDSLPSPDSKNIIFGSRMRSGNPKCQKPHLPNSVVEEFPVLFQPFAKALIEKNGKPNVELIELDSSYCSGEETINVNNIASQGIKQPQRSLNGRIESDIEISEEYTCVISHGPSPKTIHFYGDQVLESVEHNGFKKRCCGNKKESIFVIAPLDFTTPIDVVPSNDFLSFCCSCSKKLDTGKDIYMYRGYKAFCSSECRSEAIQLVEKMEEEEAKDEEETVMSVSCSDKDLVKKKSNGVIFTVG